MFHILQFKEGDKNVETLRDKIEFPSLLPPPPPNNVDFSNSQHSIGGPGVSENSHYMLIK